MAAGPYFITFENVFQQLNNMSPENKSQIEFYQNELAELAKFPEMNPGPVLRFDKTGKVLLANTKAKDLFGEAELLEKNWKNICRHG